MNRSGAGDGGIVPGHRPGSNDVGPGSFFRDQGCRGWPHGCLVAGKSRPRSDARQTHPLFEFCLDRLVVATHRIAPSVFWWPKWRGVIFPAGKGGFPGKRPWPVGLVAHRSSRSGAPCSRGRPPRSQTCDPIAEQQLIPEQPAPGCSYSGCSGLQVEISRASGCPRPWRLIRAAVTHALQRWCWIRWMCCAGQVLHPSEQGSGSGGRLEQSLLPRWTMDHERSSINGPWAALDHRNQYSSD